MQAIVNIGIHLATSFPFPAHDPKFVLSVAAYFDKETRSVNDIDGKVIIRLDEKFFDRIFKCPKVEEYADINMETTQYN